MTKTLARTQPRHDPWRMSSAVVQRVIHESPGVNTYDLKIQHPSGESSDTRSSRFAFAPGQFNMLYVPGVGEAAISISGESADGFLQHTIRTVGAVTGLLEGGGEGYSLGIRGPFGTPWPIDQILEDSQKKNLILVAGGIGIAPLRSVVVHLMQHRNALGRVDVLIGARTPQDLIYASEYQAWSEQGIMVHTTVDRADKSWKGRVGVVTLLVDRLKIPDPSSTILMTCGPEVMMRFVVQSSARRGIPESNTWVSLERNMNCAIGLCGHCQMGPAFLCKDGPVFRYDRVAPWLHVQGM